MKLKGTLRLVVMLTLAGCAGAQTTGTITATGTNPAACSATATDNSALSSTIALGTLNPANDQALTTGNVIVRFRSSKAYVLSAQATALNFTGLGAVDSGTTIALSDIGFGITATTLTGANVANTGSRTDAIVAKFLYTSGWPSATNGLTPFVVGTNGTLNDLIANTQILSGGRISAKGNISTNNNFILVTLGVATLPQYFTPNTSFSSTVTLTMTCP